MDAEQWLKLNTAYCNRYHAWMSRKTCEHNRYLSAPKWFGGLRCEETGTIRAHQSTDYRCEGCNGLDDQPLHAGDVLSCSFQEVLEEIVEAEVVTTPVIVVEPAEGLDDDLAVLNGLDFEVSAAQLEVLLPGITEQLESLENEAEQEERPVPTKLQKRKPTKIAVYSGRCQRCGGYMLNAKEGRLDDTYRCIACGWWVSPVYLWNRNNPSPEELDAA